MAAADALEGGDDPFRASFLAEHDVTSAECINLARQLALGARIVAEGLNHHRSPQGTAVLMSMVGDL